MYKIEKLTLKEARSDNPAGFFVGDMYYWEDEYNDSPYGLHQFQIEKIPLIDYTDTTDLVDSFQLTDTARAIQNIFVNHLPVEDAEILRLHYGMETPAQTLEQISDLIGISHVAVHKRIKKALKKLKEVIETSYPDLIDEIT